MAKPIEALARGLEVLQQFLDPNLLTSDLKTLAQLHEATGIPKSSLLGILETLRVAQVAEEVEDEGATGWRVTGDFLLKVTNRIQKQIHFYDMRRIHERIRSRHAQG